VQLDDVVGPARDAVVNTTLLVNESFGPFAAGLVWGVHLGLFGGVLSITMSQSPFRERLREATGCFFIFVLLGFVVGAIAAFVAWLSS
jgi:hypothetical protein